MLMPFTLMYCQKNGHGFKMLRAKPVLSVILSDLRDEIPSKLAFGQRLV